MKLVLVLGLADGRVIERPDDAAPKFVKPPVNREGVTQTYSLVGFVGNEAYYIPEYTTAAQAIKLLVERVYEGC